jgi:hypothetical protein
VDLGRGRRAAGVRLKLGLVTWALVLLLPGAAPAGERWEWTGVSRVVAIGDIHGTHEHLIELLRGSGLANEELTWTGGDAHLVVVGDFVDRNPDDREVIELLRRLEGEAAAAGGRVHCLLGNHEVMNLVRDNRYVHPGSHAAFVGEEREKERRSARKRFLGRRPRTKNLDELEAEFDRRFPPGYFGRLRSFNLDGVYGKWLIDLPVIVRVNDVVFVHGGLTESFAALGLKGINKRVKRELLYHLEQRRVLERGGVVSGWMDLSDMQDAAVAVLNKRTAGGVPDAVRNAAHGLLQMANDQVFGPKGPLWYRGLSMEDERIERDRLGRVLELLGAERMVVAHSPTPGKTISSRFGNRLYRVDHGIYQGNRPLALVFEYGEARVLDPGTGERIEPGHEHPSGELAAEFQTVPDAELEHFLDNATVVDYRELGRGSTRPLLFKLELNGTRRRGVFKMTPPGPRDPADREIGVWDRHEHEIAAYRLDRRLGLGMVPVTVPRSHEEHVGSLQVFVEGAVDQESVLAYDLELLPEGDNDRLMARTGLFDALIGNRDRSPSDILYVENEGRIMLIDHSRAFSTSHELDEDAHLPAALDPELREALSGLDPGWSRDAFDGLLSEAQVEALLVRRDRILARYEAGGTD